MRQQSKYFPTLDGWRGLSVIGVILYHGRFGFFSSGSLLTRVSAHGELGVDFFFAISGFLICRLLLNEYAREGGISLSGFYIRRSFRILPAYYAFLAVLSAISLLGILRINDADLPSCLLFFRNYRLLGMDEAGGFYTAHFWSLAVEEHFYLVWPMLLLAVKPRRMGRVALSLALAVAVWRGLEAHYQWFAQVLIPSNLLARTDAKVDGLLWGCIAAIYLPEIQQYVARIRFSQLWLPIAALLLVIEEFHIPGLIMLQSVLIAALVVSTVLQPDNWLGRLLEWRPLRWVGAISYSLYLWQELFLPEIAAEKAHGVFHYLQQPPCNVLAILLCACLSRYLLEIPMNRLGHSLSAAHSAPHRPASHVLAPNLSMRGV